MRGSIGTSTGMMASKQLSKSYFKKGRSAKARLGKGVLWKSKPKQDIVVILPNKSNEPCQEGILGYEGISTSV